MSRKIRIALVVAIVAALGYVAWELFGGPAPIPGESASAVEHASPADAESPADARVHLRGSAPGSGSASPEGRDGVAEALGRLRLPDRLEPPPPGSESAAAPRADRQHAPITGMVRVGAWPAREGTVRIQGAEKESTPARIDESGRFQLRVPVGRPVALLISLPGRQTRTVYVRARSSQDEPIEIVFGEGRIHGVVHGADGSPLAGAAVRLGTYLRHEEGSYAPSAEGHVFRVSVLSDADGAYAFTDLAPGRYVLVANTAPERTDARNMRSFEVRLEAGESRRLDIGGVYYDPTWSGTVRYADGSPIDRAGNIFLKSLDGQRRMYVGFDAEGRFAEEVAPDTYRMEFVMPGAMPMSGMRLIQTTQTVTILPGGAVDDVVVPGARVRGVVRGTLPGPSPRRAPPRVVFTLESSEEEHPPSLIAAGPTRTAQVLLAKDGTFAVDGLCAGVWRVTGSTMRLTTDDGRPARLTLAPGTRTSELVLRAAPLQDEGVSPR